MRNISIIAIIVFYIFFFARAWRLKVKLGKSIKADDFVLNLSIFMAGFTSVLFLLQKTGLIREDFFFVLLSYKTAEIAGTVLILLGLITSSAASLGLGASWRIGVDEREKTDLVTTGIYGFSRNPYFLSYDLVLAGLALSSLSLWTILSSGATIALFHFLILREETYLEKIHGRAYLDYKDRVRRYL